MVSFTSTTFLMGVIAAAGVSALPKGGPAGPGGFGGPGGFLPSGLPSSCVPTGPRPTVRPTGPPPGLPADCSSFFTGMPTGIPAGARPTGAKGAPLMEKRADQTPKHSLPAIFSNIPSSCQPPATVGPIPTTMPSVLPSGIPADCTSFYASLLTGAAGPKGTDAPHVQVGPGGQKPPHPTGSGTPKFGPTGSGRAGPTGTGRVHVQGTGTGRPVGTGHPVGTGRPVGTGPAGTGAPKHSSHHSSDAARPTSHILPQN